MGKRAASERTTHERGKKMFINMDTVLKALKTIVNQTRFYNPHDSFDFINCCFRGGGRSIKNAFLISAVLVIFYFLVK